MNAQKLLGIHTGDPDMMLKLTKYDLTIKTILDLFNDIWIIFSTYCKYIQLGEKRREGTNQSQNVWDFVKGQNTEKYTLRNRKSCVTTF
jgi:hypothetical protein